MSNKNDHPQGMNRRDVLAGAATLTALGTVPLTQVFAAAADPVAGTTSGEVSGTAYRGVLAFRGIPYGAPTAGAGRFLPPTKPAAWQGVRESVKAGPRAFQTGGMGAGTESIFRAPDIGPYFAGGRKDMVEITEEAEDENCLVLNVLTPALAGKRTVLVYIHGGGFAQGTGALTLGGDRFVTENDVVLVSINHRLNALGYTYLGGLNDKYADSGNVGQLDLVLALQWVKANIGNFGGDPDNVTIFGESGGGAKVSCLMSMPIAKGLFKRAIIESGSSLSVRTKQMAIEDTNKLLAALKLGAGDVAKLAAVPPRDLIAAAMQAKVRFGPVVDGRSVPHQTWEDGAPPESAGVPLMVGVCKDESSLFAMSDPALYSLDWTTLQERVVKSGIPADKVGALIAAYRKSNPADSATETWFRMATDRGPRRNALKQADAKLAQKDDVYVYYFAWDTGLAGGKLRAFHTAELPLAMRLVVNPAAEELSKQIGTAWASFARTGNPNHKGLPTWDKYSSSKRATMIFDAGKQKSHAADNPGGTELALLAPHSAMALR